MGVPRGPASGTDRARPQCVCRQCVLTPRMDRWAMRAGDRGDVSRWSSLFIQEERRFGEVRRIRRPGGLRSGPEGRPAACLDLGCWRAAKTRATCRESESPPEEACKPARVE